MRTKTLHISLFLLTIFGLQSVRTWILRFEVHIVYEYRTVDVYNSIYAKIIDV